MGTKAKQDVLVRDALGLDRLVFAGQTVPNELVDAYEKAVGESQEKAQSTPEAHKAQLAPQDDKAQKAPAARKSSRRKA